MFYSQVPAFVTPEAAVFSVAAVNSNGAGVAVIVHLEAPSEVDRAPWEVGHRGAVNVVLFLIFGYLSDNNET